MNFIPKNLKRKKQFKRKIYNQIYKNVTNMPMCTGNLGLKAVNAGFLSSKHFETIKQTIRKLIKKTGRILFFIFPQTSKTRKPVGMRMGKGKGNIDHWVCKIQPGAIICEINTSNILLGTKALITAQYKMPLKTKLVFKK